LSGFRVRFGDTAADHRVALIAEQVAVVTEVELEPVLVAQQQVSEVLGQLPRVWQARRWAPNRPYPAPPTEPQESSTDSYDSRNQRIASRATPIACAAPPASIRSSIASAARPTSRA
jgi:hypothetical protein